MIDAIRQWVMGIAATALLCAIATELTPKGAACNVLKSVCAIVMALAVISPLINFDFSAYSLTVARYKAEAQAISEAGEEISNRYNRTIIEESSAAYILDKAESLSIGLQEVRVRAEWSSEGYWYPVEIELGCAFDSRLSSSIESELGIKGEMQYWIGNENA